MTKNAIKELLEIKYTDNGSGISKKDLPHIFEPLYTSDQNRGTGLGLNIIYNLVKQKLHGTITCESEQGMSGGVFCLLTGYVQTGLPTKKYGPGDGFLSENNKSRDFQALYPK